MNKTLTADFLVIGGGIIGLCLALEGRRRHPDAKIILIEKEQTCGAHASTRNSGVLHAGFYYTADSLKARFTREGNARLQEYCDQKGIAVNRCGKLVVAKDESELPGLEELLRRGQANSVPLRLITAQEAQEIEPRVKTFERALFSPTTASVDPVEVMDSLVTEAKGAGIDIQTSTAYMANQGQGIRTTNGIISTGYVINAAGLYADKIALDFGYSQDYRILPFKGLYLYAEQGTEKINTQIYPVPDLANPFLGVHFTVTSKGDTKIGPTAIPAFWREHYQGIKNFKLRECFEVLGRESSLFFKNNFGFRKLALEEIKKYRRHHLVKLASTMVTDLQPKNFRKWGHPGIRAQLFNIKKRMLEMDFRYEGDHLSFHVLNAVSPAFTCALPFCEFLFDQIEKKQHANH